NESAGNGAIARGGSYAADHERMQFGARNSRLGFKLKSPEFYGIKASGIVEADFLGNQPSSPPAIGSTGTSESSFFSSAAFRVRHMAVKVETPIVDILAGQYWQLIGWQSYFHPNTVEIQGVPGQVYSRQPQLRISKTIKTDVIDIDLAIAAARPPQRN